MTQWLSDLDITIPLVPGLAKWPTPEVARTITWDRLRDAVAGVRAFARGADRLVHLISDNTCRQGTH